MVLAGFLRGGRWKERFREQDSKKIGNNHFVAVSGGVDSMALLTLIDQLAEKKNFIGCCTYQSSVTGRIC